VLTQRQLAAESDQHHAHPAVHDLLEATTLDHLRDPMRSNGVGALTGEAGGRRNQ
jgi:hypothetical protein